MMNEPTNTQTATPPTGTTTTDLARRLRQMIDRAARDQARQAEQRVAQQLSRQLDRVAR